MSLNKQTLSQAQTLAQSQHMPLSYIDSEGEEIQLPDDRLIKALKALGIDPDQDLEQKADEHILPSVLVLRMGQGAIRYCLPERLANHSEISWSLVTEQSQTFSGQESLRKGDSHELDMPALTKALRSLEPGYHQLSFEAENLDPQSVLVVQAPEKSFQQSGISQGVKYWGSAIQLYTLKSDQNWGVGDFFDLALLGKAMTNQNAGFIGLNPLHALYPGNPEHASPYSPSNRQFLNVMYIRPDECQEFQDSDKASRWFNSTEITQRLQRLRALDYVDYQGVAELKLQAFELMFEQFQSAEKSRITALNRFVEDQGYALKQHCLFDALFEYLRKDNVDSWGWNTWPECYQNPESPEVKDFELNNRARVEFYQYLQFIAFEQLNTANQLILNAGMPFGLYRDLAVGADRGGSETWSQPELFSLEASVGAPPDALGPLGQNWGLPPYQPERLRADRYQAFVKLLRANMQCCSALRIDHAMALYRLWWCPPGETADQGAYVCYPFEDLLGILLLESHRNRCQIIAEDLGTVPKQVEIEFPKAELFSNKVFFFESDTQGLIRQPNDFAGKALAFVCSHDMPTLAGFWKATDVELRGRLELLLPDQVKDQTEARSKDRNRIIKSLIRQKLWPANGEVPESLTAELTLAIHRYLARCNSQLISVQLEDLLLMQDPVNIPGTSMEYPNWRRKLSKKYDDMFADDQIRQQCHQISTERE